jgi:hypothetical protein
VTIGSNFTFNLGSYQPPPGWNIDEYMNLPLPIESEVNFDEIDFHDPSFWLSDSDVRPNTDRLAELWHGRLTEEEMTTIDFESYNNSLAKVLGVPWPKYQQAVEAARHEIWNSPSQAEQSGGSYYFSLEPSARASNWSNHPGVLPTISSSEAERLQRVVNENPARFQTKEDLISALASGGFFKTDSISGGSTGPDAEGRDQIIVKLKRLWVDLRMANYRTAQADAGGFELVGRTGGITSTRGLDNRGARSDLTLPIYVSGGGEGYLPGDWVGRNVMEYLETEPGAQYLHMETLAVRDAVRARRDANLPVILIGHSWGGSQAISTALWAKENGIRIDLLITADAVGVPDLVAPRNLSSYAARLDGIATNWVNVTADRPGTGAGDVVASIWGRTPQVIQQKATLNVSARSADHADFRNMMIAINAKGLIEGVRK